MDALKANIPAALRNTAEELRVRSGTAKFPSAAVTIAGAEIPIGEFPMTVTEVLALLSGNSYQTIQEQLKSGYMTAKGGHRVGICGTAIVKNGAIDGFRDISSLNVRFCREHKGIAEPFFPRLKGKSTLIVSPPGLGKTTFLRDIIRLTSNSGTRTAVLDERGEIAAMSGGSPGFDLGKATDVLEAAPRLDGVLMLLRTMAPHCIAMDELSASADSAALEAAENCGIQLIATSHREGAYPKLFEVIVKITLTNGKRTYEVSQCR
ncbi:MAG: stage III sporulation protein AB [Oscillospiraceae bacterium]|jgi:stage III sporulation protein AA|nr:stage III sporulation protein AB [Oscillospiraceae bacterium]